MFLNKIQINGFRNLSLLSLKFDAPINVFYGDNGQGKTNIVEGIYYLANTSSFRTSYFKELIGYQADEAKIEGEIKTNNRKIKQKILTKKTGKALFINDIALKKTSEYIGKVNVVCFSPEDVSLFKDSPSVRRHFLDVELSSLFPIYVKELINFTKIIEKRNDLLKSNVVDEALLEILTIKMIESSYEIYKRRKWLIYKMDAISTKIYKEITHSPSKIKIEYITYLDIQDKNEYYDAAVNIYKKTLQKDKEKTFTQLGIHKDDFKIFIDNKEIDMYASQGQQRLISLCMKLAVCEIVAKACNDNPIIILDDAFSELDASKKENLFNYVCKNEQVFITCTDYKQLIGKANDTRICLHQIKDGKIVERSFV